MDSVIEEIKKKLDIIEYLGTYLTLKKAGRNFKAVCPFHNEKTPSFVISPDRQIWHCFGSCHDGGDIIKFLMKWENITFFEALKELAQKAGVKLPNIHTDDAGHRMRERLLSLNSLATEYFEYILNNSRFGKKGLDYLDKRGINKAIVEKFQIGYAADWSEYFGHQPADGSGGVYFHLGPLWASSHIDAVAIDAYWPLADWREGRTHLDYAAGARSTYDLAYLRGNVRGGEGFDWYYASGADPDAQVRTPITDGAGKPWLFRYKDIKSWWQNTHYNRPAGVEAGTPTAWVAQSKPFWLMEIGCPAVDKGANQPNVFVDPKSAETALPYFSRGSFGEPCVSAPHGCCQVWRALFQ